jgi:hypothetical protein
MGLFGRTKKEERIFGEDGYDRDGFNEDRYDRNGIHKDTGTKFNEDGYDRNGIRDQWGNIGEGIKENNTIVQGYLAKVQGNNSNRDGFGIVRLDSDLMEEWNIRRGDAIEIKGIRTTVAKCEPTFPSDEGKGIIRMDRYTRNNAGAPIDSDVVITKVRTEKANKIVLRPLEEIPPIDERYFSDQLKGNYVVFADFIHIPYLGKGLDYQIVDSEPSEIPLKITEKTNFYLSDDKSGIGTLYDRELHDSEDPVQRGEIQNRCGLFSNAIVSFDKALRINEKNTFALEGKAVAQYELKYYSESLKTYEEIVFDIKERRTIHGYKKKQFEKILHLIMSELMHEEKYDLALSYSDISYNIELFDKETLEFRGEILLHLERNVEALECYEKFLEKDISIGRIWNNKGVVLRKLGRDEEADKCFVKAKELEENE